MATGQDLLDTIELLFPEQQLQFGESGVNRALVALNRAQDLFESNAAQYADVFQGDVGTVVTVAGTESSAFPSGVIRIDGLQLLNASTGLPESDLVNITPTGGHLFRPKWPLSLFASTNPGKPTGYWTNGRRIYWSPLPDAEYTVRWYGFQHAADILPTEDFAYDESAILPFASVASQILKIGLDDSVAQLSQLATDTFNNLLDQMTSYNRTGAPDLLYSRSHDT